MARTKVKPTIDELKARVAGDDSPPSHLVAARAMFDKLEALSERLSFKSITTDLANAQHEVSAVLHSNSVDRDDYTVSHGWTELGVRHQWAEQQLIYALRGFTDMRPEVMRLVRSST